MMKRKKFETISSSSGLTSDEDDDDWTADDGEEEEEDVDESTLSSSSSKSTDDDEDESDDSSDSSSSDDETGETAEAIEVALQQQFQDGLKLLVDGKRDEAKIAFEKLLGSPQFTMYHKSKDELPEKEAAERYRHTVLAMLFHSVEKNLADIYAEENDHMKAVDSYLKALKVDCSDVTLWHKLGIEGIKADRLHVSKFAFYHGLQEDPEHWLCLDKLISVLFVMNELPDCIDYIKIALDMDPHYLRAIVLKEKILELSPYLRERTNGWFSDETKATDFPLEYREKVLRRMETLVKRYRMSIEQSNIIESLEPTVSIPDFSWTSVGHSLIEQYELMIKNDIMLARPLDLKSWIRPIDQQPSTEEAAMETIELSTNLPSDDKSVTIAIDPEVVTITNELISRISDDMEKSCDVVSIDSPICSEETKNLEPLVTSSPKANELKRRKSLKTVQTTISASTSKIFQRRSSRNVPGYTIADNFLVAPKPPPLPDLLKMLLPADIVSIGDDSSASIDSETKKRSSPGIDTSRLSSVPHLINNPTEIRSLIEEINGSDITYSMLGYLNRLRPKLLEYRVSEELKMTFVRCYEYWKKHVQLLTPDTKESDMENTTNQSWLHLVYCEIVASLPMEIKMERCDYLARILRSQLTVLVRYPDELGAHFVCRCFWAQLGRKDLSVQRRASFLREAIELLDEPVTILLPHANQSITKELIEKRLSRLEKVETLNHVSTLFENKEYEKVIEVLLETLGSNQSPSEERIGQLKLLCRCFVGTKRWSDCIQWLTVAFSSVLTWRRSLPAENRNKCLADLNEMIGYLNLCVNDSQFSSLRSLSRVKVGSLMNSLVKVITIISDFSRRSECPIDALSPWILFYHLSSHLEREVLDIEYLQNWYNVTIPGQDIMLPTRSLMILLVAHQELGEKRKCTSCDGKLLLLFVEEMKLALQNPVIMNATPDTKFKKIKDQVLSAAEQCFYCLYHYPNKKKRHLDDHYSPAIELTWAKSARLFEFVLPEELPEFDGFPTDTITADAVEVLLRIEKLIPDAVKPDKFCEQHLSSEHGEIEINDHMKQMNVESRMIVGELYHLLADYYLKNQEFQKAARYYAYDISYGQSDHSLDSWGGSALARQGMVDIEINHVTTESKASAALDVMPTFNAASNCFEKTLELSPNHRVMTMEYGGMVYQMRAFISRILKQNTLDATQENEMKERCALLLEKAKSLYCRALELSKRANESDQDSSFVHYFLGKIAEKQNGSVEEILFHYYQAAYDLKKEGVRYDIKIRFDNKSQKSKTLEAIEIHYRLNATVLKWLINGRQLSNRDLGLVYRYVNGFRQHILLKKEKPPQHSIKQFLSVEVEPDVVSCVIGLVSSVIDSSTNENMGQNSQIRNSLNDLVDRVDIESQVVVWCMDGLRLVTKRFPNHYKALYRLAKAYAKLPSVKDLSISKNILMGPYKLPGVGVQGLFLNRKPTNFFDGIWRIPSNDIDRSGSFVYHMTRCLDLTVSVLYESENHEMLFECATALCRSPDKEKQFLHNATRADLCRRASSTALNILIRKLTKEKNMEVLSDVCGIIYGNITHLQKISAKLDVELLDDWRKLLNIALHKRMPDNVLTPVEIAIFCGGWLQKRQERQRSAALLLAKSNKRQRGRPSFGRTPSRRAGLSGAESSEDSTIEIDTPPPPKKPMLTHDVTRTPSVSASSCLIVQKSGQVIKYSMSKPSTPLRMHVSSKIGKSIMSQKSTVSWKPRMTGPSPYRQPRFTPPSPSRMTKYASNLHSALLRMRSPSNTNYLGTPRMQTPSQHSAVPRIGTPYPGKSVAKPSTSSPYQNFGTYASTARKTVHPPGKNVTARTQQYSKTVDPPDNVTIRTQPYSRKTVDPPDRNVTIRRQEMLPPPHCNMPSKAQFRVDDLLHRQQPSKTFDLTKMIAKSSTQEVVHVRPTLTNVNPATSTGTNPRYGPRGPPPPAHQQKMVKVKAKPVINKESDTKGTADDPMVLE